MTDDRGQFFDAADAPYWKRHYGIGHRWSARPGWRRGCLVTVSLAGLVVFLTWLVLLIVSIAA